MLELDVEGGEAQEAAGAHLEGAEGHQAEVASEADLAVEEEVVELLAVEVEVHQGAGAEDDGCLL